AADLAAGFRRAGLARLPRLRGHRGARRREGPAAEGPRQRQRNDPAQPRAPHGRRHGRRSLPRDVHARAGLPGAGPRAGGRGAADRCRCERARRGARRGAHRERGPDGRRDRVAGAAAQARSRQPRLRDLRPAVGAGIRDGNYADLGDGIRLHYACAGRQGEPLMLFLHGFPEFWYAWRGMLPYYGRSRFAVAPDLRGYNLSSRPAEVEHYRIGRLIEDVDRFIKALGYQDAIVVAHDWGGALAWSVAISRPQLVSRLVMMNAPHPVPFARALAHDPAQQAASQYMNWLRRPGSEDALAADDFALMQKFLRGFSRTDWLDGPTLAAYKA